MTTNCPQTPNCPQNEPRLTTLPAPARALWCQVPVNRRARQSCYVHVTSDTAPERSVVTCAVNPPLTVVLTQLVDLNEWIR